MAARRAASSQMGGALLSRGALGATLTRKPAARADEDGGRRNRLARVDCYRHDMVGGRSRAAKRRSDRDAGFALAAIFLFWESYVLRNRQGRARRQYLPEKIAAGHSGQIRHAITDWGKRDFPGSIAAAAGYIRGPSHHGVEPGRQTDVLAKSRIIRIAMLASSWRRGVLCIASRLSWGRRRPFAMISNWLYGLPAYFNRQFCNMDPSLRPLDARSSALPWSFCASRTIVTRYGWRCDGPALTREMRTGRTSLYDVWSGRQSIGLFCRERKTFLLGFPQNWLRVVEQFWRSAGSKKIYVIPGLAKQEAGETPSRCKWGFPIADIAASGMTTDLSTRGLGRKS